MCIPQHAAHPVDAMMYMDFVYQPKIAAMIAEDINYITPVARCEDLHRAGREGAPAMTRRRLEDLATSPLIFPTPAEFARLHRYRVLTRQSSHLEQIFQPMYQS